MPSQQKRLQTIGQKSRFQKFCQVCQEVIKGYHSSYGGGLSCSSCRVFFRRQISKNRSIYTNCYYTHSACTITPTTRTYCQHCRLQKCLAIGMDPKRIQLKIRSKCSSNQENLVEKAIEKAVRVIELPESEPKPLVPMPQSLDLTLTYMDYEFCQQ